MGLEGFCLILQQMFACFQWILPTHWVWIRNWSVTNEKILIKPPQHSLDLVLSPARSSTLICKLSGGHPSQRRIETFKRRKAEDYDISSMCGRRYEGVSMGKLRFGEALYQLWIRKCISIPEWAMCGSSSVRLQHVWIELGWIGSTPVPLQPIIWDSYRATFKNDNV